MLLSLILPFLIFKPIHGANILVIIPTPSYSHQVAFTELWKELSLRGHKVTVTTTDPRNDTSLTNLTEINMERSYDIWSESYNFSKLAQEGLGMWNIWDFFLYLLLDIADDLLLQPQLQELINEHGKYTFDLVIAEVFYPELLAFGKIYNCPTMLVATIDSTIQMYQYLGNPVHPAINSDINVPFAGTLNFKERLISTLFQWKQNIFEYFTVIPIKQRFIDKHFGNVAKGLTLQKIINDIDIMLVNVSPFLKGPRALSPTTINVGGGNHLKPLKPLPKELKDYLDSANEGFIYLSLGGNVKSKDLHNQTMVNIMETLRELPQKVLWKFETDDLPGKPENVKLIPWAPQQDILRHPNIRLFIMQGGIQSIEEAIFTHVPLIIMPFYGDQLKNARIIEIKELGKAVNHKPVLDKNEFKEAILEIINNNKYKDNMRKLAEYIQDEPLTGLEKSIWWTEYVIRHKGARQLRNPAADIPFYQYYLLDVLGFLGLSIYLITLLTIIAASKLYRYTKRTSGTSTRSRNTKIKSQ